MKILVNCPGLLCKGEDSNNLWFFPKPHVISVIFCNSNNHVVYTNDYDVLYNTNKLIANKLTTKVKLWYFHLVLTNYAYVRECLYSLVPICDILLLFCYGVIISLSLVYHCFIVVSSLFYHCFIIVLSLFYHCFIIVSSLFIIVSSLFHHCFIIVS